MTLVRALPARIKYLKGVKYVLSEDYVVQLPIVGVRIIDEWFRLTEFGHLTIFAGFAWDGASGPTFDTKDSMRASLVHDVLCIAMRDGRLDFAHQDQVNAIFKQHCIEDGMAPWRAWLWHAAVEFADAGNPTQGADPAREVLEAP